jgi:hypothetical protein
VNKVTEGLLPLPSALLWPSARENPAAGEAGCVDPVGSFGGTAGPDQREAVIALAFQQRGIDRGWKARIVELDREIFAITLARGLLPRGAEFDAAR